MRRPRKASIVDTNVLVRHLLGDDPDQSRRAHAFLRKVEAGEEQADLTELVVAETVWVLEKSYQVPRGEIAASLSHIVSMEGVLTWSRDALVEALESFAQTRCDIVDCLLAARARTRRTDVCSFEADFDALGCGRREP